MVLRPAPRPTMEHLEIVLNAIARALEENVSAHTENIIREPLLTQSQPTEQLLVDARSVSYPHSVPSMRSWAAAYYSPFLQLVQGLRDQEHRAATLSLPAPVPGAHIPGVHIPGVHIPGTQLPTPTPATVRGVPGRHLAAPSQRRRAPVAFPPAPIAARRCRHYWAEFPGDGPAGRQCDICEDVMSRLVWVCALEGGCRIKLCLDCRRRNGWALLS